VFVVDVLELLDAELADALAAIEELFLAALRSGSARSIAARSSGLHGHVVLLLLLGRGGPAARHLDDRLGRRECRRRAHALLLRIALGELLRPLVVEVRAHDHVAQDAVGVLHPSIELGQRAVALEDEEMVDALVELLDGIGQTAAAPRVFVRELGARRLADFLELGDQRGRLFLRYLRRKDEQDFVRPHKSSFWPSGAPTWRSSRSWTDCQKNCPEPR